MVSCDRCDTDIEISTTEIPTDQNLTKEQLKKVHEPDEEPITIVEGMFVAWTTEFDTESRGRFRLLLCRECTDEFVAWADTPDVDPTEQESYDHSIEWSHVDNS